VAAITVPVRLVLKATPRSRLINLDFPDRPFSFRAGQAVMVGLHDSPLRKPYSIASAPWELARSGTLQLLAQVDDTGSLDPHLELATPGTLLDLDGPFGTFELPEEGATPLLFVAGGTGIAPLRSMLIERLARPPAPPIALIYSARSTDEFAFRAELGALEATGRLKTFFTVTRAESDAWHGRRGRIGEALLREALPSPDTTCLVCGPPHLVNDTSALLRTLGVQESNILLERY
jgi:CDP-4-dehydro-6-deoxyglucose reductase